MKLKFAHLLAAALFVTAFSSALHATTSLTAEQALKALQDGQARFFAGKPTYPNQDAARRVEVAKGQSLVATVALG